MPWVPSIWIENKWDERKTMNTREMASSTVIDQVHLRKSMGRTLFHEHTMMLANTWPSALVQIRAQEHSDFQKQQTDLKRAEKKRVEHASYKEGIERSDQRARIRRQNAFLETNPPSSAAKRAKTGQIIDTSGERLPLHWDGASYPTHSLLLVPGSASNSICGASPAATSSMD